MHCRHLTMMCGLASMFSLAAHVNRATAQCEIPLLPTGNGESDGAFLGASVAITESLLVVGAPRPTDAVPYGLGLVYLYHYDPQLLEWSDPEILQASDGTVENYFGRSVDMSGDVVIVGAPGAEVWPHSGAGKAYIYTFNGSTWDEDWIQASDAYQDDRFGQSVAIDGDWVIVGADQEDESGSEAGAAYLFHYESGAWAFDTKLTPAAPADGDRFGCSVALQGDVAIVGAWGDDGRGTNVGAVYVYRYEAPSWIPETKLTPPASLAQDRFGSSVALDGDAIIIGAPGDDDNGTDAGAAYVFRDSGGSWEQEPKLLAVDGDADDEFGTSVAISGAIAVVGAPSPEWYLGDETAVHVFLYQDPLWTYEATLRNAGPPGKTEFGYSVAAGDGFAAAGGPWAGENWYGAVYVLGGMRDCNANGILDACEIFEATSEDCNGNWVPDECDVDPSDPDGNGQVSDDCQPDGIPDECQIRGGADIIFVIDGSGSIGSAMYQLQKDGIINYVCGPDTIVPRDGTATLTLIEFWDEAAVQIDPMVIDSPSQADLFCYRVSQLNQPGSLNTYMAPALDFAFDTFTLGEGGARQVFISTDGWVEDQPTCEALCDVLHEMHPPVKICTIQIVETCENPPHRDFLKNCANTWDAPDKNYKHPEGEYVCIVPGPGDVEAFTDLCNSCTPDFYDPDCNDNGVPDICDIADGFSHDWNENGIPDECETECEGDLDIDGDVDTADLLALLANWGPCPLPCPPRCVGDIEYNCVRNTADLLALLASWTPPCSQDPVPRSIQDCINRYLGEPEKLEACIEAMIRAGTP